MISGVISADAAQDCEDASFWKAGALEGRQERMQHSVNSQAKAWKGHIP